MDEARTLRDTLERAQAELRRTRTHLEKLRAHQARERESLLREVEKARGEVAELRARLEAPPEPEPLEAVPEQAPPGPVERAPEALNALVALVRRPESLEAALPMLSWLLGVPPADMRLRLAAPPPTVLTRVPASEAEPLRAALQSEGFVAVSCEVRPRGAEGLLLARRFSLDAEGLQVEGAGGERQHLPYAQLRLLVRGRRTTTTVEQSVEWVTPDDRDASMLRGGRGWSRPELKTFEMKQDHHSQFLWAYGEGGRVAFSERTLFAAQGVKQGTTLGESLQTLGAELRQRAPQVVMDERLVGMPRFSLPLVDPKRSQELFAELLFEAVRRRVWP
jgi:hypothetical protein